MSKEQKIDPKAILQAIQAAVSATEEDGIVRKALVVTSDQPPVITIPSTMDKLTAAKELKRQWEEEETEIDVDRTFEGWKWQDTLIAVKAMAEKFFGWIDVKQSFFNPPTEIEIVTDVINGNPVKQTAFYGQFKVVAFEGAVCTIQPHGGTVSISFHVKKKFKARIEEWFNMIDNHLLTNSIYRGKSVLVRGAGGRFDENVQFEIIETKPNDKIVLNPKERSVLEQYCSLDLRETGKRTYLFTGGYGNGKTEAAMILGSIAKNLGMTFFYVKESDAFVELLSLASKNYQPTLIFMEDIDEIGTGEERNAEINNLLNTLDGAETKGRNIKVLFTTNHHENINPALRRPGRLDLIVRFENPDKETRAKIYAAYLDDKAKASELDYELISEYTPDCSGAFVAEICKRSIRLGELAKGLTNDIVISAINTIKDHLALMTEPVAKQDELAAAMRTIGKELAYGANDSQMDELARLVEKEAAASRRQVVTSAKEVKNSVGGAALEAEKRDKSIKKDTESIINNM
jgi:DNA replication protein DnaC